ncbi:protein-tyrosine phosphatase-like protein [Fimicolochytrium jonesii]|uniref:protein-tyrosine phosphatase-like protein n=1 Tax=Fimicolochytrium jonesii TaxID=1396493 RepID=UPI0022FDEF02|nr:protein-tyrosine phosphatase-like protein [Fimicolochytrium jonesii]KAI8822153.1 protein-tyrosine phosphatase-like protein [Fimicolochytrium jonesii]
MAAKPLHAGGVRPQRIPSANKDGPGPRMPNPPSLVEYKNLRFLIFDAPSDRTLDLYWKELEKQRVTDVVRVCDPTYDKKTLEAKGVAVHDWPFPDGDPPPAPVVAEFLNLVNSKFGKEKNGTSAESAVDNKTTIGVHCVAGLGRAPVLVTMALIEAGMAPLDAVIYVRERRRGAINARQLKYVENYKRRSRGDKGCIIS